MFTQIEKHPYICNSLSCLQIVFFRIISMNKRIRIKDIAALSGVSPGTVDRILHNRGNVSEKARISVEKVLKQVGYKPNIHLSGLSLKRIYEIIVTTPHASHGEYWESLHDGIKEAVSQHESINIKIEFLTYDQYNIYSCRDVFSRILKLSPDAVIIGPTFKDETMDFANKLQYKNIPFAFVDSMVEGTSPLAFYSANHYICGYLMCKLLRSLIPESSEIGMLQAIRIGDQSANTSILRRKGAYDFLTETHFTNKIRNIPFSAYETRKNEEAMEVFFASHHNVKGVIVLNSRGNIVSNFLFRNGMMDVKLVCVDLTEPNILSLKADRIHFLIDQNPSYQGYMAMKTLLEYLILQTRPKVENYMPLNIVTKETVDLQLEFNLLKKI